MTKAKICLLIGIHSTNFARWSAMGVIDEPPAGYKAASTEELREYILGQEAKVKAWRLTTKIRRSAWMQNEGAPTRTIITEGVEDALSLQQTKAGTTIIASLGIGNIGKAPVDTNSPVVVFRDGDNPESSAEKGRENHNR